MTGTCSSSMTFTFSLPFGKASGALPAKGLSVRARICWMYLRVVSGAPEPQPSTPSPPALDTAATSFGSATRPMPAFMIGYLMPKSSVIAVFMPALLA